MPKRQPSDGPISRPRQNVGPAIQQFDAQQSVDFDAEQSVEFDAQNRSQSQDVASGAGVVESDDRMLSGDDEVLPARLLPSRLLRVLLVFFVLWGIVDVRRRGEINPENLSTHRTDVTVYTEAGAAFFDGREPYEVTNVRGWKYLYPPIFALLMAPLHNLAPQQQAMVWYFLSLVFAWGCYSETVTIARLSLRRTPGTGSLAARWIAYAAVAAVALPMLNCLQRGQIGIAKLYLLLAGLRLVLQSRSLKRSFAGGLVLALPVAFKITPIMPVGFLIVQQASAALATRPRASALRAVAAVNGGLAAGLALYLLLLPAALLGWSANCRHIQTWWSLVGTKADDPGDDTFAGDSRSIRNQSLLNAVYLLGEWTADQPVQPHRTGLKARAALAAASPAAATPAAAQPTVESSTAAVSSWTELCVQLARLGSCALVVLMAYQLGKRRDAVAQVAGFGLACAATLVASPISRAHYFVLLLPATVFLPLWLAGTGRPRLARIVAFCPAVLTIAHYLAIEVVGQMGLLGIGTSVWFFANCALVLYGRPIKTRAAAMQNPISAAVRMRCAA